MEDVGKLALRVASGSLLAAHGAQKLFGVFEGPGLKGFAGYASQMGLKPPHYWALAAGLAEFGGGSLTALGLFWPLGPIGMISAMSMATAKVHLKLPIFTSKGGAELPLLYASAALALALTDPGTYSLDNAFGIRLPTWFVALATTTAAASVTYGILSKPEPASAEPPSAEEAATL